MGDDLVTQLARAFGSHGSLAEAAGVKNAAVSQWKRRRNIPADRRALIAKAAQTHRIALPNAFYADAVNDA